jgi:Bacillus/Clostridium GerA spore germination protein
LKIQNDQLNIDLKQNEQMLREIFHHCSDIDFRNIHIADQRKALCVSVSGLVDIKYFEQFFLKPMIDENILQGIHDLIELEQVFKEQVNAFGQIKIVSNMSDLVQNILKDSIAFILDGVSIALIISSQGFEKRSIEEPLSESVIRGPREGFVEYIQTNMILIRRRIRSPRHKVESPKRMLLLRI